MKRCDACKGTNIQQQVMFMIDPNNIPPTLKMGDGTFDDYFYCMDCEDECHVEDFEGETKPEVLVYCRCSACEGYRR